MAENATSSLPPPTDGEYAGHKLIAFTAVFLPFQVLAVGLRYYARWIAKAWGREDAIVVVSLGFQIITAATCIGESPNIESSFKASADALKRL
jgi:hypothetical protein